MPYCHLHPTTQVITDFRGVATCERCEAAAKAARSLLCASCSRPVRRPGLCPDCKAARRSEARIATVAHHAYTIVILIIIVTMWLLWPTLSVWYHRLGAAMESHPNGPDPPPQGATR